MSQAQPPSGGCVLKHFLIDNPHYMGMQPPSGGCVLKHVGVCVANRKAVAAAFGRLCVETIDSCFFTLPVKSSRLRAAVC